MQLRRLPAAAATSAAGGGFAVELRPVSEVGRNPCSNCCSCSCKGRCRCCWGCCCNSCCCSSASAASPEAALVATTYTRRPRSAASNRRSRVAATSAGASPCRRCGGCLRATVDSRARPSSEGRLRMYRSATQCLCESTPQCIRRNSSCGKLSKGDRHGHAGELPDAVHCPWNSGHQQRHHGSHASRTCRATLKAST